MLQISSTHFIIQSTRVIMVFVTKIYSKPTCLNVIQFFVTEYSSSGTGSNFKVIKMSI